MIVDDGPQQDSNVGRTSAPRNIEADVIAENSRVDDHDTGAQRTRKIDTVPSEVADRAVLNGDFGGADNADAVYAYSQPVDVEPFEQDLVVRWSVDDGAELHASRHAHAAD